MQENNIDWKKIILTLSLTGLIVFLLFFFISRLNDSTITISTNEGAKISMIKPFVENEIEEIGSTQVTLRLNPGFYTFIAQNDSGETRRTIELNSGNDQEIDLSIVSQVSTEEVATLRAKSIHGTSSGFDYVDTSLDQIYSYSSPRIQPQVIFPQLFPVVQVNWSSNNALVELPDGFRVIQNNTVRELKYPNKHKPSGDYIPTVLSYDVAQNGKMVFNFEGEIFYYDSLIASPEKIYSGESTPLAVRVSDSGHVVIFNHPDADSHSGNEPFLMVVDNKGSVVLENQRIAVSLASISSDGSTLVYDDEAVLKQVSIENPENSTVLWARPEVFNEVTWVSDEEFLIYNQNSIYIKNIQNGNSYKLATIEGRVVNQGALNIRGDDLFIVSSDFNSVTPDKIYKISLSE